MLSRYRGIGPDLLVLYRSKGGKPSLTKESRGQPAITFNMAHAHGRALIAVSRGKRSELISNGFVRT